MSDDYTSEHDGARPGYHEGRATGKPDWGLLAALAALVVLVPGGLYAIGFALHGVGFVLRYLW